MSSDQKSDRILCAIIVILVIIFNGPSKHAHPPPSPQDAVFYLCDVDTHNSAGPSKHAHPPSKHAHPPSPPQDAVFYLCDVDTHNSAGVPEEGFSTHKEFMWELDDDIKEKFPRSLVPAGFYTDNKVVLVVILFRKQMHREAGLTAYYAFDGSTVWGVCSTTTTPGIFSTTESMSYDIYL